MKIGIILVLLSMAPLVAAEEAPHMPMATNYANSITSRWLAKEVLAARLLDGMENLSDWTVVNRGQSKATIALTKDRKVEGASAVRLVSTPVGDTPLNDRYFGMSSALRRVNGENWSDWNRLSFWIYPDLPGFRIVSLQMIFRNEGAEPVPDRYGKMGNNYLILRNHEWNHIVWEISNLPRDKVVGVEFMYKMQGKEPGATDVITFDFDKLELQKVNTDHWEGWNVAPGAIAYSHSGYQLGSLKSAIASGLDSRAFQLINCDTGMPVLEKPLTKVKTQIGEFEVMDFSEVREPGTYLVRAGGVSTRPFPIANDVWTSSIWKAINFFYAERCGFAVPGVHDICHRDWLLKHGEASIVVNGGWHDAGDLSQSFGNTAEATYAMFHLAERLQATGQNPRLARRIIEEAAWGLDWVLKTSFGDGYRASFCLMDRWTNGIIGDVDDMVTEARNSPDANFVAAAAEAVGARLLREADPQAALHSLRKAEEDWRFAVAGMEDEKHSRRGGIVTTAGHGVLASLELWQSTGQRRYADKAIALARILLESQQSEYLPGLTYRLAGLYYTAPEREQILRASHSSHEASPTVALARLCDAFPEHPDWIRWYSAVVLYTEYYQKAMAAFSQPYGMLANSVFRDDEYLSVPPNAGRDMTPESYRAQVLNGVKVGERHFVRLFPVWFQFRGNHGTVLTQTKALSVGAHLRRNVELASLCQQQLQWVMGRNPFVQSTMWGEGYDYAPQYSAMSGDIVGSLPVGIQTRGDRDIPYWPTENCHNWKEVWVLPVSRWLWLMSDLAGPALVHGLVDAGVQQAVEFRESETGHVTRVHPDFQTFTFRARLPEGKYEVASDRNRTTMTLLPGGSYTLDLREGRNLDLRLKHGTGADGTVSISASLEGHGRHKLSLKAHNVRFDESERWLDLKPGVAQIIHWEGRMISPDAPWVAVVIPDHDLSRLEEATGSLQK